MGKIRRVMCTAAVGLIALSAPTGVTGARSFEAPGVAFADEGDLAPEKENLRTGVRVSVCNSTGKRLTARLLLTGFEFTVAVKDGARPVATRDVVTVQPSQVELPAGRCNDKEIVVRSVGEPAFDAASYDGFLTVITNGGGLARRKLTVPGKTAAAKVPAATGAADTLDLHGSHTSPHWLYGEVRLARGTIALTYAGEPPELKKDTRLGTVAHGSEFLTLYSAGDGVPKGDRILAVPVRVEGKSEQGVFTGNLDPEVAGSAEKPVAVTVTVADHLAAPVLVLLLGLALGVVAKLASGRCIPRKRWGAARDDIRKAYAGATVPQPYGARYAGPSEAVVEAYLAKSKASADRYASSTLLLDPKAEAYTKIDASLTTAATDAAVLAGRGEDGLAAALAKLDARLTDFAAYLAKYFRQSPSPVLARTAAGLVHLPPGQTTPTELPVGGAVTVVEKAAGAIALMDAWTGWADELRRYRAWVDALAAVVTGDDAARLSEVAAKLVEVHFELLDADDPAEVERMQTAEELRTAYRALARLSGRYRVYVPSDWETDETDVVAALRVRAGFDVMATAAAPPFEEARDRLMNEWRGRAIKPLIEALAPHLTSAFAGGLRWLLEALVLFVSGGLALAVAFHTLVAGKAFGSLGDYLGVLALGVGAELVVGSLLGSVNRWRSPVTAT